MSDIAQFRTTRPHMLKASKEYASQTLMGGLSGFESPIGLDRRDRIHALKSGDIGFVHSWDINTSVDGPGTRILAQRSRPKESAGRSQKPATSSIGYCSA